MAHLLAAFYLTYLLFIVSSGGVAWLAGFNIFKFISYIKEAADHAWHFLLRVGVAAA
jgi:Na+/H+-dicarboxylate symporter